jgi:trigger factor
MMKKRWMSALALTICAALLGGCGAKDNNDSNDNSEQSKEIAATGDFLASDYVTLGQYQGVEIAVDPVEEYDEDEIELQTKSLYFSYVTAEEGITDRPVELLDMTNIDYEGKKDGVAFDGGTAQGATLLIGSGQFIDGFEDGLIGVMPGETVDLDLTFPESYGNSDLAGQAVVFTVTVNFIAEMDDEHVAEIGIEDVNTLEELRAYVQEYMDSQAQSTYQSNAENAVLETVLADSEFAELPADKVAENRETYAAWLDQMASSYDMDGQAYVEMYGRDYESTLDEYAEEYTKRLLVIQAIAEQEGMTLTDEELDARMEEYAESNGVTVEDLLTDDLTKEDYRQSFLYDDVMDYLVENAVNTAN